MNQVTVSLVSLVCIIVAVAGTEYGYEDYYAPANYKYDYAVHDPHTGDKKEQYEVREGDVVKGAYSVADPDGTTRVVEYVAGPHTGFNAVVKKIGHAYHPQDYGHGGYGVNPAGVGYWGSGYGGLRGAYGVGGHGGYGGDEGYGYRGLGYGKFNYGVPTYGGAYSNVGVTHYGYNNGYDNGYNDGYHGYSY